MNINCVRYGRLDSNTYIIDNGYGEGFLIDACAPAQLLQKRCGELDVRILAVLYTHGHYDHITGGAFYAGAGTDSYIHRGDAHLPPAGGAVRSMYVKSVPFVCGKVLEGGESLNIAGIDISVISTPGHSKGSVCYIIGRNIFSGDTLFYLQTGRTDLPGGDDAESVSSLQRLYRLEGDFTVYPGHGIITTLEYERHNNYDIKFLD